jgi:hypothetical protein
MTDRRMDAYYYGFERTGVDCIDKILSAVACAGKAFHHTESWNDDVKVSWNDHTGGTPVDWIQNAANKAAEVYVETGAVPSPGGVEGAIGSLYSQLYHLRKGGNYQEEYEAMKTLAKMLHEDMALVREKYNVNT